MTTQPFPNDSEAESCDECGGDGDRWVRLGMAPHTEECPYCDGTGRALGWVGCEWCGETTYDHGTGAQQCQKCRLEEWEVEKERRAVEAYDRAYEEAERRVDREAALAEDAHERMMEGA